MHVLPPSDARRQISRLPGSVPDRARVFGNVLDPESEINYILKNKRVYILKEEVGTHPRFYYFFEK